MYLDNVRWQCICGFSWMFVAEFAPTQMKGKSGDCNQSLVSGEMRIVGDVSPRWPRRGQRKIHPSFRRSDSVHVSWRCNLSTTRSWSWSATGMKPFFIFWLFFFIYILNYLFSLGCYVLLLFFNLNKYRSKS